jgi:multiple sugar transport system substrate-binding protein
LERAGFTLAEIPKEWEAFWSFWCDEVQPAVRKALGRDDIWGIGLPMAVIPDDTDIQLLQFQLAYGTPWFDSDRRLRIDDPAVRAGIVRALERPTPRSGARAARRPNPRSGATPTTTRRSLPRPS